MKNIYILCIAMWLAACGGSGGVSNTPDTGNPPAPPTATESQPLTDNSGASAYKVLLMGNSHAAGVQPVLEDILLLGQPDKSVDLQMAPGFGFLADRINDGMTEEKLASEQWTHVVLQAQKYSSSNTRTYPTTAAEHWVRRAKEIGATPIMFPEHPRRGNYWEGQTLWDLHTGIAARENTCVAPVGLVWDEVIYSWIDHRLHATDGNHASETGALLTALVFYQIISGQPVESVPELSAFGIDAATEQLMKDVVSSTLFTSAPCAYETSLASAATAP